MFKINLKLLDFIRAMKKFNRKQVFGSWYAIDIKTDEVCGCAMGQAILNMNWLTEEQVRHYAKTNGVRARKSILDPLTGKKELREVIACSVPVRMNEPGWGDIPHDLRMEIMRLNDNEGMAVGDIAALMYERYANG